MENDVLSTNELRKLVEKVDRNNFQMFDFDYHGVVFYKSRLRTTGAQYCPMNDRICINPKMFRAGKQAVIKLIKHELCHFYITHTNSSARPHGKEFKVLLHRVGGCRYAPCVQRKIYRYFYRCQNCGHIYKRQRPVLYTMYACSRCHGFIRPIKHAPVAKKA